MKNSSRTSWWICDTWSRTLARPRTFLPPSKTLWGVTFATISPRSDVDNMRVNSTGHTVLYLCVELWKHISIVNAGLLNITHDSLLDYVTNKKPLHGLILGSGSATIRAVNEFNMATPMLVTVSIPSFERHGRECAQRNLCRVSPPSRLTMPSPAPSNSELLRGFLHDAICMRSDAFTCQNDL
jgi:hypothetical protein